ncbi:MAG: pyridoxal-phosphate dependent enzyme, partial [Thermaerobacterales bacterium]
IHYETTGPEIWRQTDGKIDVLVAGVGTGGTLTGAGQFLRERNPQLQIVAVEPQRAAVLSGGRPGPTRIFGLGAGFLPGVLDRDLIDQVIAVSDDDAYRWARDAARREGLLVGPSAGAALAAAAELSGSVPAGARMVVILPDTGERYSSLMPDFQGDAP